MADTWRQEEAQMIREAIAEAQRFIDRAERFVECLGADKEWFYQSPERAAMKRASMDLSRILPRVRGTARKVQR